MLRKLYLVVMQLFGASRALRWYPSYAVGEWYVLCPKIDTMKGPQGSRLAEGLEVGDMDHVNSLKMSVAPQGR